MIAPGECRNIEEIRKEIDRIDKLIITALAERNEYVKEATKFKKDIDDVVAANRHSEMLKKRMELSRQLNTDENLVEKVYQVLLDYYKQKQLENWKKDRAKKSG
jgi:isochorismate pyruvate lyase